MRKLFYGLLILSFLLTGACSASAWEWMSDHILIEANIDSEWVPLKQTMYYSHENYRVADGFLMFMSISQYVKNYEIQEALLSDTFAYRVTYDDYIDTFESKKTIQKESDGMLCSVDEAFDSFQQLPHGKYLISFSFNAMHLDRTRNQKEAYKGVCFLWLIVE